MSLRIGVVGGGLVAQAMHLQFLSRMSERFDLVALADPSATVRDALQRRLRARGDLSRITAACSTGRSSTPS